MSDEGNWTSVLTLDDQVQLTAELFQEQDLDAIYRIECRTHQAPWRRSHFADSLKAVHHHCVGVRQGRQWLAYAIVSCIAGQAELLLLVVDVEWQKRGVAKQLLAHVFQCLAGRADTLFLEVRASNRRAIALYEQQEFHQVGVRPDYYKGGGSAEDAIIFARVLSD